MKTVVIAGAGYAGLSAAIEISEDLADREWSYEHEVLLVNEEPYHVFLTELHSLATGVSDEDDVEVPLDRIVRAPLRLLVDRVERVQPQGRTVGLASGRALAYSHLILAVGSVPEDYGISGVKEYANFLTDAQSAMRIRDRLDRLAERGFGEVVLVGAGLTGVELAAEIKDTYRNRLTVRLLEAGERIMPGIDPGLVAAVTRLLSDKDVKLRTGVRVNDVTSDAVEVADGTRVHFDLLLWTAGVRANPLIQRSGLVTDRMGRALTDAYLRVRGLEDVFAAGDCAAFATAGDAYLAPTAQAAEQMGRRAAGNIVYALRGEEPEPFEPHIRGFFASLGEWEGVGQAGREEFFGLPAVLVTRLIEAQHAFEAGGTHALLRRLVRNGERLLWGSMMGERRYSRRMRRAGDTGDKEIGNRAAEETRRTTVRTGN